MVEGLGFRIQGSGLTQNPRSFPTSSEVARSGNDVEQSVVWRIGFRGCCFGFRFRVRKTVPHPGGNPGANLKSISHRYYLFEVAFVWELTKETIELPLGCLQGGRVRDTVPAAPGSPMFWSPCDRPPSLKGSAARTRAGRRRKRRNAAVPCCWVER